MKQTISLALVAGASTVVVAAALSLPQAHAQAPNARSVTAAPPSSAPAAAPVSQPAAPKAPYPAAVPVRAATAPAAQPAGPAAAPSPAPAKAAPAVSAAAPAAPATAPATATAPSAGASGPAKLPATLPAKTSASPSAPSPASPSVTASAPPSASPPPPPPAPALPVPPEELLTFFKGAEGTWRCDGKMPAGAVGPESRETPYKSTVKLKRELGGFWMAGEYEIKKSKLTPGAQARFFIGFEPRTKQFVSASFDSFGGMDRGGSPGVQGNSLALTGTGSISGTKVQTRSTLTFTTPGKDLDYKFELDRGQGFQLVGQDTCKKGAAAPPLPGSSPAAGAAGAAGAADQGKPALAPKPAK